MLESATTAPPELVWRAARIVALALLVGVGVNHLYWSLTDWNLVDMQVYWDAAMRLREGEPLYADGANTFHAYRYAPWFAYAWVPLTYVPQPFVGVVWSAILLAAGAAVLWPLMRIGSTPAILLIVLMLPLLVPMASGGNVQPLMVAALLYGLPRRSGPLWIALAASLKVTPILFVLVYLARGEWLRAGIALVLTAALLAPALLMGLGAVTVDPGPVAALPAISPALYIVATGAAIGVAFWICRTRGTYGPLAAATAAVVALPRLFLSDVTTLLAGLAEQRLVRTPTDSLRRSGDRFAGEGSASHRQPELARSEREQVEHGDQ